MSNNQLTDKLTKFRKQVHLQMKEIDGLQTFNQGLYHNNQYEQFVQKIIHTRQQFRTE